MSPIQTAEFGALVAQAFASGGIEVSIRSLSQSLGGKPSVLEAALEADAAIRSFNLELFPGIQSGEYDSPRVLRPSQDAPLSALDRIMASGESQRAEFKSSMYCAMAGSSKSGNVEHPSLQGEVLKSICALINSDGGDLLVGVDDDGVPSTGIAADLAVKNWSLDQWQLNFHSLVKDRFYQGTAVRSYLQTRFVTVSQRQVYWVTVTPRSAASFVQRKAGAPWEYFQRNGPRSDSLDLPAFYEHLQSRASP